MSDLTYADQFFAFARARYQIKLRRDSGSPPPWTDDPILRDWRFCNVFREDDRTTEWFRQQVRSHLAGLAVVEATVIFRWFNRIETGERIKDLLLDGWESEEASHRLKGVKPLISGAYKIGSARGLDKLEGLLRAIDNTRPLLPAMVTRWGGSLAGAWRDLRQVAFLGPFLAYELVSDLRWTPVLGGATDVNTWANAGPGCSRGIGWVMDGRPERFGKPQVALANQGLMRGLMRELLQMSRVAENWPPEWPPWEMREVEHVLCEWDKYNRARRGDSLKRRFVALAGPLSSGGPAVTEAEAVNT